MNPKANVVLLNCEELNAISRDMRKLFDDFRAGTCERSDADSAANVAGKNLKAQQLLSANTIYNDMVTHRIARFAFPDEDAAKQLADSA